MTVACLVVPRGGWAVPDAGVGSGADARSGGPGRESESTGRAPDARSTDGDASGGPRIADVSLRCDLPRCKDPVESEKLLDLAGLYPGRRFSSNVRIYSEERLRKTGLFETIDYRVRPVPGGVSVTVQAVGARRIRSVEFVGWEPPPFESDLRKLLLYRGGQQYRGDSSKKSQQLASLEAEFREDGHFGTDVEMRVEPVEGDKKLVDIVFRISKGNRLRVCDIGIRGHTVLSYDEARRALLDDTSVFARRLQLIQPPFTSSMFKAGQQALVERYRRLGFFQARISDTAVQKSIDEGCVTLLVEIDEGPQWKIVFEGNSAIPDRDLREELPFDESGYVDAKSLQRAETRLRQLYATRGYPFAEIATEQKRVDEFNRRLVFEIDEGIRYEIDDVVFHGVSALSPETLRGTMGTKPFELFEPGGYLQVEQLLADFRKIEEAYRKRGYLRAYVESYRVEVRRDSRELVIHVDVVEGVRTTVSGVRFAGLRSATRNRANERIEVGKGEPFVPVSVRADGSRLDQMYSSIGYPLANVETECRTRIGTEVPCKRPKLPGGCVATSVEALKSRCTWSETEAGRVRTCRRVDDQCRPEGGIEDREKIRVVHRIDEGPLVTTGGFLVQGNSRTRDTVVGRELPLQSGEIFDVRKLLSGQRNLRSLGIFDSVSIEAIGLDELASETQENRASLLVTVEEARNRFFEFKFGLEGRDLLNPRRRFLTTAEVQYSDRNLFGWAVELEPKVFGAADILQLGRASGGLLEPGPMAGERRVDYLFGAELPFRDPRFLKGVFGIDDLHLTVTPFYLVDLLGVMNDRLLREEWGLAAEVRKELTEVLEGLFVSFGIEAKQSATAPTDGPVIDGERIFSPRRITGKLIPKITLDRRDSPLNPSEGIFLRVQPELVSGDAFSPQVDTIDDSYLRVSAKLDTFIPLWERTVLAQSFRAGQAIPLFGRQTRIPADERFFLGGAASLRGYPNNSLGPSIGGPPSGELLLNYNLELRYPLIEGVNVRGAMFFDAGMLVDCFGDRNRTVRVGCYEDAFGSDVRENVRLAAGVGLRYLVADQIPLVFDYGVALDRDGTEQPGSFHFRLGYTF